MAMVSADRKTPLNDSVEPFFDECGVENMTDVARDLLDDGSGEARELPIDPISNHCKTDTDLASSAGGISGSGSGSTTSVVEDFAEGRYVANWPLGEGRDVSVSDAHSYRHSPYDPGRGPGDRSVLVSSNVTASITFDGPERFVGVTTGDAADLSAFGQRAREFGATRQ